MLHPDGEVGLVRVDDQMEVGVHQAVSPAAPLVEACDSFELRKKTTSIGRLTEHRLTPDGQRSDVVRGIR